ncbi:hypothetical protein J4212_00545 [Candidatus Woesearchaeota archaeon]|nr:hypothetical protein [Candidatus Woesearchaeota archaeon]
MSAKSEIIEILAPIFGKSIQDTIEAFYDEGHPQELYNMAHHMLSEIMGPKNAETILSRRPSLKKPESGYEEDGKNVNTHLL